MKPESIEIAKKPKISETEWEALINELGGNLTLALAARIFYLLNPHSTHVFDYSVPHHMEVAGAEQTVAEYITRAELLIALISKEGEPTDADWFLVAQLIGAMAQGDYDPNPMV